MSQSDAASIVVEKVDVGLYIQKKIGNKKTTKVNKKLQEDNNIENN
jgi:hypothetical protein